MASSGQVKHSKSSGGEHTAPPPHSPLGGSGAYRWMVCSGSVGQSKDCVDEESEYAALGTAAHKLGEECLRPPNQEPWTYAGNAIDAQGRFWGSNHLDEAPEHIVIDKEMVDAVQSYIDAVSLWHPDRNQGNSWVEREFHSPQIHEYFYGKSDFVYYDEAERTLHVWDYKHGAGIVVEATRNPQGMYYASGVLEDLDLWEKVDTVVIHIVQPRGWHYAGPHRTWEVPTEDLIAWLEDECIPAMDKALVSRDTIAGEHCRFCAARSYACPSLMEVMVELQELLLMAFDNEKGAEALTNKQLGRIKDLEQISKIVFKAAGKVIFGKLSNGANIPGAKLVNARTNREYKKGAEKAIKAKLGKKCMTKPKLMSPAQLEGLPGGKALATRYAFKPEGNLTVAAEADPRRRINRDAKSLFTKKPKGKKK